MKIVAIVVVVVLVAASVFADYKWRQWMATRRPDRE
jgi:general stress protein CsbA